MPKSYAQCGQDLLADFILRRHDIATKAPDYPGTYIDVGCCEPVAGSNSYFFYERGWKGLCVDANPDIADRFRAKRPNDTVVSCGVGAQSETLKFYRFRNQQHNTFNGGRAEKKPDELLSVVDVPVRTLTSLIEDHLPANPRIDFLSVDAEGFEMPILSALDFARFRPTLVVLEVFGSMRQSLQHPVVQKMEAEGYTFLANTGHDAFFVDKPAA